MLRTVDSAVVRFPKIHRNLEDEEMFQLLPQLPPMQQILERPS